MSFHLTVTKDFGSYKTGDTITDAGAVKEILENPKRSRNVVKINPPRTLTAADKADTTPDIKTPAPKR